MPTVPSEHQRNSCHAGEQTLFTKAVAFVGLIGHGLTTSLCDYRLGSERGSPNHGRTLASKRVIPQIRSPDRVSTWKPVAWRMSAGSRRYAPNAGWPLARVGTRSNLRPAPNWRAKYRPTSSRP